MKKNLFYILAYVFYGIALVLAIIAFFESGTIQLILALVSLGLVIIGATFNYIDRRKYRIKN